VKRTQSQNIDLQYFFLIRLLFFLSRYLAYQRSYVTVNHGKTSFGVIRVLVSYSLPANYLLSRAWLGNFNVLLVLGISQVYGKIICFHNYSSDIRLLARLHKIYIQGFICDLACILLYPSSFFSLDIYLIKTHGS
jgi:hypothetical protein